MSYAVYNPQTNTVRTWVTAPSGELPAGYEFREQSQVPSDASVETLHPDPIPVPNEVPTWALREVCMLRGHTAAITAALEALPEPPREIAKNRWNHKDTISRGSSMISAMQQILGWTNAYVDELFVVADELAKS